MNNVIDPAKSRNRKIREAWHDLWQGEIAEEMQIEFAEMLREDKEAAQEAEEINQAMLAGQDNAELSWRIRVLQMKACRRVWDKLTKDKERTNENGY